MLCGLCGVEARWSFARRVALDRLGVLDGGTDDFGLVQHHCIRALWHIIVDYSRTTVVGVEGEETALSAREPRVAFFLPQGRLEAAVLAMLNDDIILFSGALDASGTGSAVGGRTIGRGGLWRVLRRRSRDERGARVAEAALQTRQREQLLHANRSTTAIVGRAFGHRQLGAETVMTGVVGVRHCVDVGEVELV